MLRLRHPRARSAAAILAAGFAACSAAGAGEADRIVRALAIGPGSVVADVGAGDGKWSVALARRVGAGGRVWATEVDEDLLAGVRARAEKAGLANVATVRGDQTTTGLPEGCCDAILLRLVYHHFVDPAAMRDDLRRALRPGGRLAIVDILPQRSWRRLPEVPERGGHGIPPGDLEVELTGDGFELVERFEDWNGDPDRYCLVFRSAADS